MPTPTRVRRGRPLLALACAGALALGATACGGSGSGGDADPADAVPATAPFYAEVAVNPDGDLRSDTEAALKKILGTDDVGAEIERLVKSSDDPPTDEEYQDLKDALGERVGLFFTSLEGTEPEGAAVLALADRDKFDLETEGGEERTYKDVDYWVTDGDARAVVDDFGVIGTERGVQTVIDTVKGDDVETMSDNDAYEDGLEALGAEDALASAYIDTAGIVNAIGRSGGLPAEAVGQLRQQLSQTSGATSVMAVRADGDRIAVDVLGQGIDEPAGEGGAASAVLQGLPSGAWFGIGFADVGGSLRTALQQALQVASLGGEDVSGQLQAMEQALGIDLESDLLSWMGDAGLFVQGATVADIGGGFVVQTNDPTKTAQAIGKLRTLIGQAVTGAQPRPLTGVAGADAGFQVQIPSLPFPLIVAGGGDTFVIGLGAQAVEAALSPSSTLADSDAYKAAADQLDGVEPGLFIDVAAISTFVKGLGLDSDPAGAQALGYVDRFGAVVAGSARDGKTQRSQLVITLK